MQHKNKRLNTTFITGPLQYLTKESTRWDDRAMKVICVWLMINAAVCLKNDARRAPRVRVRKGRSEWTTEPDMGGEPTPGDNIRMFKHKVDSLQRDPSFMRKQQARTKAYYRKLRIAEKEGLQLSYY